MSGAQTSSFANVLFDPLMARKQTEADIANQYAPARNQLYLDVGAQKLEEGRQAIDDRTANRAALSSYINTLGIGGAPQTGAAPAAPGSFEQRLGGAESGNKPGAVNAGGYAGQFQFGAARLADLGVYHPADGEDLSKNEWKGTFSIPGFAVATHDDFLKNQAAQHSVFGAHVANIDQAIAATPGADKLDPNGLRAVAHLGGVGGMQRFIATGGLYDPADANGTRLSTYYAKFAAGGAAALQQAFGSPHGPDGPEAAPVAPGAVPYAPPTGLGMSVGPGGGSNPATATVAGPGAPVGGAPSGPAPEAPATAATAPPAAAPPATGGLQVNPRNGLTPEQERSIAFAARDHGMTAAKLADMVDGYQKENAAAIQLQRNNARQAVIDEQTRKNQEFTQAHTTREEKRQADRDKLAADKAAAEKAPFAGTGDAAEAKTQMRSLVSKIRDGSASQEERDDYALSAEHFLKPTMQWVEDGKGGQQLVAVPGKMPEGFPHPTFRPGTPDAEIKPPPPTKRGQPLPQADRTLLIGNAGKLDGLSELINTFKPEYGGHLTSTYGDLRNTFERNTTGGPQSDWWQNYQRQKLAVRQGISGQSLTASELAEFDKADITTGMSPASIETNLRHQLKVLQTAQDRWTASLRAGGFSPEEIDASSKPAGQARSPDHPPPPPGFKVIQ